MSNSPKLSSSLRVLASENGSIPYHPDIAKKLGSVTAAILFQQVLYWYSLDGEFYKFKEPCDSSYYAEGDSWTEELGFTRREFDCAWKKLEKLNLASKRITQDRRTFYTLNEINADGFVSGIYAYFSKRRKAPLPKGGIVRYQKADSYSRNTETTSETTTKKEKNPSPTIAGNYFLSFSDLMKLRPIQRKQYLTENNLTHLDYNTTLRGLGINPRMLARDAGLAPDGKRTTEEIMQAVFAEDARRAAQRELENEPVT